MNPCPPDRRSGRWPAIALLTGFGLAALGENALAQGGSTQGSTPFASIYRRPSLSPYNQLAQQNFNPLANQSMYQQTVLPQIQQQQQVLEQLAQRRQMGVLQNQVQQIQRDTSARQLDESIRPTGHRATFMNYSHFYGPR